MAVALKVEGGQRVAGFRNVAMTMHAMLGVYYYYYYSNDRDKLRLSETGQGLSTRSPFHTPTSPQSFVFVQLFAAAPQSKSSMLPRHAQRQR